MLQRSSGRTLLAKATITISKIDDSGNDFVNVLAKMVLASWTCLRKSLPQDPDTKIGKSGRLECLALGYSEA